MIRTCPDVDVGTTVVTPNFPDKSPTSHAPGRAAKAVGEQGYAYDCAAVRLRLTHVVLAQVL